MKPDLTGKTRQLTRNAARCVTCGDIVESTYRHDFRACSCKNIFVDGGLAYERAGVRDGWDSIETMYEYECPSPPSQYESQTLLGEGGT